MSQGFLEALGRGGKPWRVVNAVVDDPGAFGKNRTGFMGITTNTFQAVYGKFLASSSAMPLSEYPRVSARRMNRQETTSSCEYSR
jgi:hypothetical protein